jgi:GH15 family glucan-1,4-alpha-glucosidase
MIDPRTGGFLGNFPQAYSHVGLIHTALNLNRALTENPGGANLMAAG